MQVLPAILEKDPEQFKYHLKRFTQYFHHLHIDVEDGKFVPGTTLTVSEILDVISNIDVVVDLHLMVEDYQTQLDILNRSSQQAKISRVFIHARTNPSPLLFEQTLPYQLGIVINPEESVEIIGHKYNLSKIQYILIMSVNPGLQGQSFMKESLNKIDQLRKKGYKDTILIDGGINSNTITDVLTAPSHPDIISVGSYFTKTTDAVLPQNIVTLQKIINSATLA